jgi:hypothetical protein
MEMVNKYKTGIKYYKEHGFSVSTTEEYNHRLLLRGERSCEYPPNSSFFYESDPIPFHCFSFLLAESE